MVPIGTVCPRVVFSGILRDFPESRLSLGATDESRRTQSAIANLGGHREGYSFSLDEVQLGPIVKKHVRAGSANYMAISKPLLGHSFFEGTAFTVDNEAHVLRFAP